MVSEAPFEETDSGLVPAGEGWFVLNAREARWRHREGRGERLPFEGDLEFPQVGVGLYVLARGSRSGCTTGKPTRKTFSFSPARRC
jgi:hypothetical protein